VTLRLTYNHNLNLKDAFKPVVALSVTLAMFKPDEAVSLLAERFNMIGWIYKQEPIMFNRLASRLAALPTWTRPLAALSRESSLVSALRWLDYIF